jgi:internalin A
MIKIKKGEGGLGSTAMALRGERSYGRRAKSLSENSVGSCGEGFWLRPRRRGRSIPAAGCDGRANADRSQKNRRPEGFRGKGRLASLLLGPSPTAGMLPRRVSPSSLFHENRTPRNFQTGSKAMFRLCCGLLAIWVACSRAFAAESTPSPTPIFADNQLEKAVRRFVLEKRDSDKPLVEADLASLSTIQANGMDITNLSGLEKCVSLASLDLAKNKISNLEPLKTLTKIQYLNLANNQIEDISPLREIIALQYIELSHNRVKDVQPLASLTNLASLYLSHNVITDIAPLTKFRKLSSLYLDNNTVTDIAGLNRLTSLLTLSLNNNAVTDLSPLVGLNGLYYLFLENNKIEDLTPLITMTQKDYEGEKRFAPFLNVYLKGNSIPKSQIEKLATFGTRISD